MTKEELMPITKDFDTIAAISTPLGEGAIGIVRISGSDAITISKRIFKGKDLANVASHTQIGRASCRDSV